jgi:hypothetical protein
VSAFRGTTAGTSVFPVMSVGALARPATKSAAVMTASELVPAAISTVPSANAPTVTRNRRGAGAVQAIAP